MTDEDALLATIRMYPREDTPRLAYADYLDEFTDRGWHAALIRNQVFGLPYEPAGITSVEMGVDTRSGWMWEYENLARDLPRLHAPIAIIGRGFVAEVRLTLAEFIKQARDLFTRHPIERVVLTDKVPYFNNRRSYAWMAWRYGYHPDRAQPQYITNELGRHLTKYCNKNGVVYRSYKLYRYRTAEDAQADLCQAAVTLGRQLVGLPPLPTLTEVLS